MNIFKSFGLKKNTSYDDASEKREVKEMEEFFNEQEKEKKRYDAKGIDDMIEREQEEGWARDTDEHFAAQEVEPGEGISVKGRASPKKFWGSKPRLSAEQERLDTGPGKTDFEVDQDSYGARQAVAAKKGKTPKGKTLADKRRGVGVLNMFKVFGLHKDDVSSKNYGGGKLSPSSEKQEDGHPDEDKKKTSNGGGEDGD